MYLDKNPKNPWLPHCPAYNFVKENVCIIFNAFPLCPYLLGYAQSFGIGKMEHNKFVYIGSVI